ncbi:polysaccharide biosynthesis/export family protein [Pararhodonellum marinum]|uniref:polysaccharide biosynthesis/export family protein n=1 Tax=Pararhodonellum marinum TaxID=2755358 RepID=UPI00188FDC0B|nr:polysaccharide biosynthesis/export family protein [Pararhodonellum marinum]
MKRVLLYFVLLLVMGSCAKRNLVYLSEPEGSALEGSMPIKGEMDPRIQPGDVLQVSIVSLQPETSSVTQGFGPVNAPNKNLFYNEEVEGFLVNRQGQVNMPVLGKVALAGLNKEEAIEKVTEMAEEFIKDPIVDIRFLNFKVTVIGEVNNPNTFTVPTAQINIFEALGMAGDMTEFGQRENVLLIRERDGIRTKIRLNLNDNDVLGSPYYYLQQNDMIYVEPHRMKAVKATTNERNLTLLALAVSIITPLIWNFANIFGN